MMVARGDVIPIFRAVLLASVLDKVSDEAWTRFVRALETQPLGAVSKSNGLGCYEMRPRRLCEIGLMDDMEIVRIGQRQVWNGTFVLPLTRERFLASAPEQYKALVKSCTAYDQILDLEPISHVVSRSGALAVLHRAGDGGLKNVEKLFPETRRLLERANGIF